MGNNHAKKIAVFTADLTSNEVKQKIIKTGVHNDCDFLFYLDASISNVFANGTTLHYVTNGDKSSTHMISNPYLMLLEVLKDFPFTDTSIFKLYFFGSLYANKNSSKLELIESNIKNIDDLIQSYCSSIKSIGINNTNGSNIYHKISSIDCIVNETIEVVKKTNKFTVAIIIINEHCKLNSKEYYKLINNVVDSTKYPIEYICIYIGNGDATLFNGLDDFSNIKMSKKKRNKLEKKRNYDNFQTVVLNKIIKRNLINKCVKEELYRHIFMELPQVYEYIKRQDILNYIPKHKISNPLINFDESKTIDAVVVNLNNKDKI